MGLAVRKARRRRSARGRDDTTVPQDRPRSPWRPGPGLDAVSTVRVALTPAPSAAYIRAQYSCTDRLRSGGTDNTAHTHDPRSPYGSAHLVPADGLECA